VEIEPGFPCPKCGSETQVFWNSKTGFREGWSCPTCKRWGYFKGNVPGKEIAILIEA
jgi:lipopolysaccharide biosynthesis regulator YciM